MVNSGFGQLDRPQVGNRGLEPRSLAKSHDGDVWEPPPPLALVDAEVFQPLEHVLRDPRRSAFLVAAGHHSDKTRLAVALRREDGALRSGSCLAQRTRDRVELLRRPRPEKRERDVQALGRDDPAARELTLLPLCEPLDGVVRQRKGKEQPRAFTAAHASGGAHAAS